MADVCFRSASNRSEITETTFKYLEINLVFLWKLKTVLLVDLVVVGIFHLVDFLLVRGLSAAVVLIPVDASKKKAIFKLKRLLHSSK